MGGAALAAYRLHRSLLDQGMTSIMIVQDKNTDDFTVLTKTSKLLNIFSRIRPILDTFCLRFYRKRSKTLFSTSQLSSIDLIKKINQINPDIVHLHWVCGGMLKIESLAKIRPPIVWTFHDMWPLTGGCHYTEGCSNYKNSCGECRVLGSIKGNDLSRHTFKRKFKTYNLLKKFTIICSSRWMKKCSEESSLLKGREVNLLKNCIDTSLFRPIKKDISREFFKIPPKKKVVLFGAMNSLSDPRKGAKELFRAINMLDIKNTIFVVSGASRPKELIKLKYPVYFIHPLKDEESLVLMYNVADVMVVPSLQENLANSISESMSCGIPVVAFNIGGNPDMIDHKSNGYLSKEGDCEDLANGIEWVLENGSSAKLSVKARDKIINQFDNKIISNQHIELYRNLMESSN